MLLTFERKALRTIFGAIRERERWRRRYNFELKRDFREPDIVAVVQRLRLAVGRPKMRWIGGVLGIRSWRNVARERERWIEVLEQAKADKWL